MKKKLKNLRKSNFIHKFNLFFTNIKPIKLNNFQIIISIYAIIFSAFLVLSLPDGSPILVVPPPNSTIG